MPDTFSIVIIILAVLLFLVAFLMVRTLTFARPFEPVEPVNGIAVDINEIASHLSTAVNLQTVSTGEIGNVSSVALELLRQTLETTYPRMHAALQRQVINQYSLLYTWKGSQPELPPVLFSAHQDVVPADPSSLDKWQYPPFSGKVVDGAVWGRGTLDMKGQLISLCETVEELLKQGYTPQRTIFLAFGHDEEIGGTKGARLIAEHLKERHVELEAILDEGGLIGQGILPGVEMPVALVGVGEKGYLTLELAVECEPGHSSTPPRQTAIGILGRALARLEEHPLPVRDWMVRRMFRGVGAAAPFPLQTAFANQWLFRGMIRRIMAKKPTTDATIRTTTAVTMISGGIKDNILPHQARAAVNFRLMPGDTIAAVCDHVRRAVNDPRVQIHAIEYAAWEASPISPTDSTPYLALERTIRQVFGNIPVAPYLMLGVTDSRHYTSLCQNVYRFNPYLGTQDDLHRIHGINERISLDALAQMVKFYGELIRSWCDSA